MNVLVSSDANYLKQLAVALDSLSTTARMRAHRVFVLHDGFSRESQDRLQSIVEPPVELVWIDVAATTARITPMRRLPAISLAFLSWEELLPADVGRLVTLDVDVVVRHSLSDLYALDMGDALVAAVRDAYHLFAGTTLPWRALGIAPSTPYFNSGVMLVERERWKSDRVGERARALFATNRYTGDQDALNAGVAGRWASVNPRWNVQSHHFAGEHGRAWTVEPVDALQAAIDDPAIVHFCFGTFNRPWVAGSRHPFRDEWFAHLDRTPWAGWRPKPAPVWSRAAARARRAACVMRHG